MRGVILVLGAGAKPKPGAINMDRRALPGVNLVHDLEDIPWPLPDRSATAVYAEHVLEHMREPVAFLQEVHRVGKPGALVVIEVPHWKHHLAHAHPEHRSTWAHNSFDENYATGRMFTKERIEFRIGNGPFRWLRHPRLQRLGRVLCKHTGLVSGLRFYLRVPA